MAAAADTTQFCELVADAVSRGRSMRIRALGHSMRPFIPHGSIIQLQAIEATLQPGDVVAARIGTHFVIHRVTSPPKNGLVHLRGDANRKADPPIPLSAVLARATRLTTPAGWVMRLDTPQSRLIPPLIARLRRAISHARQRFF